MTKLPFDLDQSRSAAEWIIFIAGMGLALSNPRGSRMFWGEIRRYLDERAQEKLDEIKNTTLSQALYNARKMRLIKFRDIDGRTILTLTERGRKRHLDYEFRSLSVPKPETWDRKWRMLMFDIPNNSHGLYRDILRAKLQNIGFKLFQKSVWIYPYSCSDEIDFIAESLGIGKYLNLFTITIEEDRELREAFKLR